MTRLIGNKDTIVGGRHVPLSGTEATRASRALKVLANEIHTTSDQRRLFMENVLLGAVWHGTVADEAAMVALNATSPRGCWPLDMCKRTDTGTVWVCVSNRGAAAGDWEQLGGGGGFANPMTTAGDLIIGGTGGDADRLAVGANGKVLKVAGGLPSWEDETPAGLPSLVGKAGEFLRVNATEDGVEWATPAGGGGDPHAWVIEEVVQVTAPVSVAADFPSSGVFDASREYRVEFAGWSFSAASEGRVRVDVGSGTITSSSYERAIQTQEAGSVAGGDSIGASGRTSIAVIHPSATGRGAGYIQFCPGEQATGKCVFRVESSYISDTGLASWVRGVGALSTPTSAAITAIRIDSPQNTTAGTFILKSRPLVPTI